MMNNFSETEWVIAHFQPSNSYTIAEGVIGFYKLYQEFKFFYKENGKQKGYWGTVCFKGNFMFNNYLYEVHKKYYI